MENWFGTFAPQRVLFDFGFVQIYWYSICIVSGILAAYFVVRRRSRLRGISEKELSDAVFYGIIGGLIGARAWHVFIFQWEYYRVHVSEIVRIWEGGIAIQGAIVGGIVALYIFARTRKKSLVDYTDLMAVGFPLGQAIGRWGNFFNQELFGKPTSVAWGIYINEANRIPTNATATHFHPVFLYESILSFVFFMILLNVSRKERAQGFVTALYLVGYGAIRLLVDFLRIDPMPVYLGLRLSQWVSICFILIGLIIAWYTGIYSRRQTVAKE